MRGVKKESPFPWRAHSVLLSALLHVGALEAGVCQKALAGSKSMSLTRRAILEEEVIWNVSNHLWCASFTSWTLKIMCSTSATLLVRF